MITVNTIAAEPSSNGRVPGSVWSYISPSRLSCWMSCPLKFKLRYIDGIRTPTTPALFLGKVVHAGLETYYRHRQLRVTLESEEVLSRMLDSWEQAADEEGMQFDSVEQEAKLKEQASQLVAAYLRHISEDEARPKAVEITMETPLIDPATGEDLGIPLLGVVDLIAGEEGGATIIDFKTSSRSGPPFEVTHEIQLSSYAYLYRQLTGGKEAGLEIRSLVKTKTPKTERQHYPARGEHHFRRLFSVIREYLDAIDSGNFNYRPGWGCAMCEHREKHCRAWSP